MDLIIHNITLFTNVGPDSVQYGRAVGLTGSRIAAIWEEQDLLSHYPDVPRLDGGGALLMPGLTNVHMHCYSTFARGLALPDRPTNFAEILEMLWWRLDRSLDLDGVYYSALIPAITAIRSGVTSVIDHHASSRAVDGSLDRIEEAFAAVGLRGVLCYETSDREGSGAAAAGLRENERYLRRCRDGHRADAHHLFDGMVGLHAAFTLSEETLAAAAELSSAMGRGCHVHLAEDPVDISESRARYDGDPVTRLMHHGILGRESIAAHCIHLSSMEKDRLSDSGCLVAHCPQSNMNNGVGRTDTLGLLKRGMHVGIGSDGMSGDLRPDVRTALWVIKDGLGDGSAGFPDVHNMLFVHNPAIYEAVTGLPVGKLREGNPADLILVDYFPPTRLCRETFWGHYVFGIADAPVRTSIINGRIVMKDRVIEGIDEAEVAATAREVAAATWERFQEQ